MYSYIRKALYFLLAAVLLAGCIGCRSRGVTFDIQDIKQDYLNTVASPDSDLKPENLTVEVVHKFQDTWAVLVGEGVETWSFDVFEINHILWLFPDGSILYIYDGSCFTPFQEAYEKGILTDEDLTALYKSYNGFPPLPEEVRQQVHTQSEKENFGKPFAGIHYGTFGSCYVFIRHSPVTVYFWPGFPVAGYRFGYSQPISIDVYRYGERKSLEQAYEDGWLTEEDVGVLWEYHMRFVPDRAKGE